MIAIRLEERIKDSHFSKKEFYLAQWGLVCPVAAIGVLGSFVYKLFMPSIVLYSFIFATIVLAVVLFGVILSRHMQCCFVKKGDKGVGKKESMSCVS